MKITALETLCLSRMHESERQWVTSRYRTVKADCAVVLIHTDEGLTGIGEASAYGWLTRIADWVAWLAPTLIGKDPSDPAIAPKPTGRGRPHDCAVAGIDCALWDLRGKIAGKRVSQLLAPAPADRVRLYASGGCRYDWRHNPEQLIEEALGYIEEGYTAMKFRIGTEWSFDGVTVDRFLGHVRELAQAVAGRMDLALDGNCRLTEEEALPIALEIERLGFIWFEEPIDRNNIAGNARLCAAVEMPITGGEAFAALEEFRPYIEQKAYDILQPDAGLSGITETARIAEMAAHYGLPVHPHSWHNGLMCMAHAQMAAALSNIPIVELNQHQGPLQWGILAETPQIESGHLILPNRPGLGVELAENVAQRFPHVEGHYGITVER
ncbi:MAG: mandelate racemase/muconate lactonizing enzyme family protein [Caldilineaceae bacterium]|nr:mandelate racemase/muconate lactonizing enzyme family protein [Caldilineaceae bacterium]HRJ41047.1 mandelate racemase/muconate lactonizing enzyme family protein [Caldilineaceae bacterium]